MAKPRTTKAADDIIDVAVVGAGASGAYACWRLKAAGRNPVLFESTDRIGGRLWSIHPPGMPNLVAELGGMRFLTSHKLVVSLAAELKLKTDVFSIGDDKNIAFLRGVQLRFSELKSNPNKVPYRLRDSEKGSIPGELLVAAIRKAVPNADKITPREWEKVKRTIRFKNRQLYNWGLWNMLLEQDVMSSEAYALLLEGGGYESLADNWNCAEACQYLLSDFPSDVHYRRFVDGYQGLPLKLVKEFERNRGQVKLLQTLQSFDISKRGSVVEATFLDERTKRQTVIRAKALILAMPQRRLKLLAQTSPVLQDSAAHDLLDSVSAMPAFKMLLGYPKPWWQELGISAGRSTTDLPARQVYYAGTEKGLSDPINENSLVLASYADGRTESFWSPLQSPDKLSLRRNDGDPFPLDPRFVRGYPGDKSPRATNALVETVSAQLAPMHDPVEIPKPYWASFKDWTTDYGGGWHFWNPGLAVGDYIGQVRHPVSDAPVYICGEAYANEQGWVEGTLKSAEHVLQEHFGLKWPAWLPAEYYLGP
jgi:monoamine oxidase